MTINLCDLVGQAIQKKEEEKRIAEEQAAKERYWKIPICDDDDEDNTIAITLVLPIFEGIPDKCVMCTLVKSRYGGDALLMLSMKSGGCCQFCDDDSSSDDRFFPYREGMIMYDASSPVFEIVSLPEVFPPAGRSDFNHEEFADELTHIMSLPNLECFKFKIEPDQGDLDNLLTSGIDFPDCEDSQVSTRVSHPQLHFGNPERISHKRTKNEVKTANQTWNGKDCERQSQIEVEKSIKSKSQQKSQLVKVKVNPDKPEAKKSRKRFTFKDFFNDSLVLLVRKESDKQGLLEGQICEACRASKGFKREYNNSKTPQSNGVVEGKKMTLIEAARTLLVQQESNQMSDTKEIIDAGDFLIEAESAQDYFVLPIWSSYTSTVKSSKASEEPTKHPDIQQVDKENQEFAQETKDLLLQAGAAKASSTNIVNTASTPVSTTSPYDGLSFTDLTNTEQDDSEVPALEKIYANPTNGIFTNSSYDDEGAVADFTNLEPVVNWMESAFMLAKLMRGLCVSTSRSGYRRGTIDKTLFIKKDKNDIMLVQVYVDDIIFGSTKRSWCDEFEALMKSRFQMSSMGELTFFLGLQVKQKEDGIFISQDKYVAEILKKFDFASVKTASTPIETQKPLVKDEEASDVDVHLYRSMIGSLMYLTASRPDIMFAVCACSRFQVTPKTSHLNAVKRIFRYLKGKPKLGLWYPRVSSFDLEAYSDSDYAGANLDRKSTTGGCQFLGRRLISWQCKKQTIVATSTTEAEYVAAANCCGQVLWIQNQMLDYGFNFMNTKIYIDNESTICIVKNPVFHSKIKHIAIRHHFIRDAYEKKLIQVLKIHTDDNVANLLTKAFDVSSSIHYALTISPVISTTFVEQFCTSAKSQTINNVRYINAKVAGKPVTISEASIRSDLHFDDVVGIDSLNNHAIFDAIKFMGLKNVPVPLDHFPIHALSNKVFSFMVKKGKHFSGKVTPLFPNMLVQPIEDEGEGSERPSEPQPTPSHPRPSEAYVEPQSDPSPGPSPTIPIPDPILEGSGGNLGSQSSSDKSLSGSEGGLTLQSEEGLEDIKEEECIQTREENCQIFQRCSYSTYKH
ncbi:putative ribonuclease H-like domain-containing protein [Tanacetum coccineum]